MRVDEALWGWMRGWRGRPAWVESQIRMLRTWVGLLRAPTAEGLVLGHLLDHDSLGGVARPL
jgi:hypothetical protein